MARLRRLGAVGALVLGALFAAPAAAWATHCPPEHYEHPPGVPDDYPCPSPGTPRPDTPEPTTPAPATATPTKGPTATRRPVSPSTRTAAPAPIDDVEVPSTEPLASPQIIIDGPIGDDQPLDVAEPSASASSWIFGFIVGLIVGGFIGRASWGLRRRRRQQIFG